MSKGNGYLEQITTLFKNIVLNSVGVERDIYQHLEAKDVTGAIALMQNHDEDVDNALNEYNPEKHKVKSRPNKERKNDDTYITEKLPRTRQRYINEVELFFLFGNNMVWSQKDGDSDTFKLFTAFLKASHFNSRMRTAKRLAGAETECAKLYNVYVDEETQERKCNVVVLARSTGYTLRPLFDRYGNLAAFGYGYKQNEGGKQIQHWDIQTPKFVYYCAQKGVGWDVEMVPNPTGKVNVIYYKQVKPWAGVQERIEREETLDSKIGDTNNYFAEPVALATADVVELMKKDDATARLIKMTGQNSHFEYLNPPHSSELQNAEKGTLRESILFDSFTPDFSFEALKGMGTLSGAAIRNSMILGYVKRAKNIEVYDELVEREKNLILAVLKYLHPEKEQALDELDINYEFAEPFPDDIDTRWQRITQLYNAGLVSLETAVGMLGLTDNNEDEIDRIMLAAMESGENKLAAEEDENGGTATEQPKTE